MTPPGASARTLAAFHGAGARIGRVRAFDGGPMIEVVGMAPGHLYGPARVAEGLSERLTSLTTVGTAGSHQHKHGRPLAAGDDVLVVFLGDSRTELVVIDRLLPIG